MKTELINHTVEEQKELNKFQQYKRIELTFDIPTLGKLKYITEVAVDSILCECGESIKLQNWVEFALLHVEENVNEAIKERLEE